MHTVKKIFNPHVFDLVVMSGKHPLLPGRMVLTSRRTGISLIDIEHPENPSVVAQWREKNDLEGQAFYSLPGKPQELYLAVVERFGALHTFRVTNKALIHLAEVNLHLAAGPLSGREKSKIWLKASYLARGPFAALHVTAATIGGKVYAFISGTFDRKLISLDVTDPHRPQRVSEFDTDLKMFESVLFHKGWLYSGGVDDDRFLAIDVQNPFEPRISQTVSLPFIRQMVAGKTSSFPDYLFTALWGAEDKHGGGLAIWNLTEPAKPELIKKISIAPAARANRIKFSDRDKLVFTPLESETGGFAVFDIENPAQAQFLSAFTSKSNLDLAYSYTLELDEAESYLYGFGRENKSLTILKIDFDSVKEHCQNDEWKSFPAGFRAAQSARDEVWRHCGLWQMEFGLCGYGKIPRHRIEDAIYRHGEKIEIRAAFSYSNNLVSPLGYDNMHDEVVEVYARSLADRKENWIYLGHTRTLTKGSRDESGANTEGRIVFSPAVALKPGKYLIEIRVPADKNTYYPDLKHPKGRLTVVPANKPVRAVLWDIDGTLTQSDFQSFRSVSRLGATGTYEGSALLQRHYSRRGLLNICVTGRPYPLKNDTQLFLAENGYSCDFVATTQSWEQAIPGEATARYKTQTLGQILKRANIEVYRAYGNMESDLAAYRALGVPDIKIFAVGKLTQDHPELGRVSDSYLPHYYQFKAQTPFNCLYQ